MPHLRAAALILGGLACLAAPPSRTARPPRKARTVPVSPAALAPLPVAMAPAELADPQGGRSLPLPLPLERRTDAQLTALPDGRLLLSGGVAQASTEILGPGRAWERGPILRVPRQGHTALLLADGRVLLLGGTEPAAPAEVLDPATGRSEDLPGEPRFGVSAQAVRLTDGRLLLVDGASARSWIWEVGRKPMAAGTLSRARHFACLTALPDGGALLTGGIPGEKPVSRTAHLARRPAPTRDETKEPLPAERFGGRWKSWSALKPALQPRARHRATLLPGGEVLLWGGQGMEGSQRAELLEVLDPQKETVRTLGTLHGGWGTVPGVVSQEGGLVLLADGRPFRRQLPDPAALPAALTEPPTGTLVNAYQEPQGAPFQGRIAVLGSPVAGPSVDRWDPRVRQAMTLTALRAGSEGLAVLADRRVVALGPVVDLVDPLTGKLTPLGWREDLGALLKGAVGPMALGKGYESLVLPQGALAVPLDRGRALVAGPGPELQLWEGPKKGLRPAGELGSSRKLQGALRLPDGSVLLWGREG